MLPSLHAQLRVSFFSFFLFTILKGPIPGQMLYRQLSAQSCSLRVTVVNLHVPSST